MLGQKNREIPVSKILDMQNQGMQNPEIISRLKSEGYNHDQISGAMDQATVKGELANMSFPERNPVDESEDIPFALMDAPSPSQPSKEEEDNSEPDFSTRTPSRGLMPQESRGFSPEPTGFAPEPLERASYDAIEEIAESIIKEKWDEVSKGVGDIRLWKERMDIDMEGVKQEIIRTQKRFEELQKALMSKVKEYSDGISNIGTDVRALEKVLEKILSPLAKSVNDLQEVSEKMSVRQSSIRRVKRRKSIKKEKHKKK